MKVNCPRHSSLSFKQSDFCVRHVVNVVLQLYEVAADIAERLRVQLNITEVAAPQRQAKLDEVDDDDAFKLFDETTFRGFDADRETIEESASEQRFEESASEQRLEESASEQRLEESASAQNTAM